MTTTNCTALAASEAEADQGRRAKPGGETGLNGEHYEGGQFMPASAFTVKGKHNGDGRKAGNRKPGRSLVEPGKREVAPEGQRAIFQTIMLLVDVDDDGRLSPNGAAHRVNANDAWEYHPIESMGALQAMIEAYNRGERFA